MHVVLDQGFLREFQQSTERIKSKRQGRMEGNNQEERKKE
jgi:hypothetical protein